MYIAGVFDFQPNTMVGSELPWIPLFEFCSPPTFKENILHEALARISEIDGMEPNETLCVHWRQDDFVGKGGMSFVNNVSIAADAIIGYAKTQKMTSVLLLSDDRTDETQSEHLSSLINNLSTANLRPFRLRHNISMHPTSIALDKAACIFMKAFAGTKTSTFSESIVSMRKSAQKGLPKACVKEQNGDEDSGLENSILF